MTFSYFMSMSKDFVNTRLLVHKHVKISVDKCILETTHPHKHVIIFGIFVSLFVQNKTGSKILLLSKFHF